MMKKTSRMFLIRLAAVLGFFLVGFPPFAYGGTIPDTPERVMKRARSYSDTEISKGVATTKRVFSALSNNRKFAAKFLELVQAGNKTALADLIAKQAGVDKKAVEIEELDKDMLVKFTVQMPGGTRVKGCIDTEDNRCGGGGWSVTVGGV